MIPLKPIKHFLYKCDKHFYVDELKELFVLNDYNIGVIITSGERTEYYLCSESREYSLKRVLTNDPPKGHKKGGQSAPRFQRLYEEAMKAYNTRIVENANQVFQKDGKFAIEFLIISGNGLRPKALKEYFDIKTLTLNHEKIKDVLESEEIYSTSEEHLELLDLIRENPDILLFGREVDENYDSVKTIYSLESGDKTVVFKNQKSRDWLSQFGKIGVKYY